MMHAGSGLLQVVRIVQAGRRLLAEVPQQLLLAIASATQRSVRARIRPSQPRETSTGVPCRRSRSASAII
jgi:hypothetical protein